MTEVAFLPAWRFIMRHPGSKGKNWKQINTNKCPKSIKPSGNIRKSKFRSHCSKGNFIFQYCPDSADDFLELSCPLTSRPLSNALSLLFPTSLEHHTRNHGNLSPNHVCSSSPDTQRDWHDSIKTRAPTEQ